MPGLNIPVTKIDLDGKKDDDGVLLANHFTQVFKGSTFRIQLTLKDTSSGTPKDLTGFTARMKIKDKLGGTTIVSLVSTADITLGGAAGTVSVVIDAAVTTLITQLSGVYDLELVDAGDSGEVSRVIEGKVKFSPEVTD